MRTSEAPAEVAATPKVVVLVPSDAQQKLVDALAAAGANLEHQGITLESMRLAPGERAVHRATALAEDPGTDGVFWIDVRSDAMRVWLLDESRSTYMRRVPIAPGAEETAREAVWLIVESGAVALVTGNAVAMDQATVEAEEATPPEPEPPADPTPEDAPKPTPTPEQPRVRGGIVLGYVGEGVANPIPWQSGAGLGGYLDLGRFARLALDYEASFPVRADASTIAWRHRAAVRGGVHTGVGKRVGLHALASLGLEGQQWRSQQSSDDGWRAVASAGLDLGFTVRVFGPVSLWIEPGATVPLNRFAFVECRRGGTTCSGDERRVVLDPWPLRPRVRVGVSLALPR